MKLENWFVISRWSPSLTPPEQARSALHGFVSGHPRCADGKPITTSLVVGRLENKVVTKSGSEYELGRVDATYESLYPNAKQRLLAALQPAVVSALPAYEI